jgi:SAM-dependent methyltransferase
MNVICPVCKANDNTRLRAYRGSTPVFQGMEIFECRICCMVFAAPVPSEEDLHKYNAGYFTNAHGGMATNKMARAFFSGIARLRYGYIQEFIRQHTIDVKRVLEIGPGPGYFAENWLSHHPHHEYLAIESDASCFDPLKKAGVLLVEPTDTLQEVDLVIMSHVLEHITNPADFLLAFTKRLRPGGALFIEVPCQDWKHKSLDEPHLLFFDKKPMTQLLAGIGLEKITVAYFGQEIGHLQKRSAIAALRSRMRNLFTRLGILWPFSVMQPGMEQLGSAHERVAVAPYKAHLESVKPAWWLRAMAVKH